MVTLAAALALILPFGKPLLAIFNSDPEVCRHAADGHPLTRSGGAKVKKEAPGESRALPSFFYCGTVFCACLSGSRSVMLFRLMPRVDMLCSSAEVVGGRMPATPSTIREKLKPTMNR